MKRRYLADIVVLVLFLCLLPLNVAQADGVIIPIPPPHVPIQDTPQLSVKYHRVEVSIVDQVARTKIDQVFVNDSNYELEGIYVFPLPEGAVISEFAMYVDGERLEGEVLDRDQARQIYEDIVRKRRDPALLEYIGRNAFRARIYPIPPHSEKRVQLEYSQILGMENGLVRYVYPLDTERFSARPIPEVSIHVDLQSKEALKSIYSPSHDVVIDRSGNFKATVSMEESNVKPDKDFVLYYTVSPEDFGLNLISYKPRNEEGFFLLLVAPSLKVDKREVIAKDVTFILDTSGSMRGEKLTQAKNALKYALDNLNADDRFNIIAFSTGTQQYADSLRPASERKDAEEFVDGLKAVGGTNIERALTQALTQSSGKRPQVNIFLTDGLATEGVKETAEIIARVNKAAHKETRLFAFGVGDEVNTILLDTLTQAHRGTTNYVRPGEDIEAAVSDFYNKISTPLLADLMLNFESVNVEDTYPYPLPDLFAGSQLVLVGRYPQGGDTSVTLTGEVNGETQRFTYDDVSLRKSGGDSFIARLWATRRIGYLLEQIRLNGEDRELVEEIVDLAVKYGIVTPYTSFLIREDVDVLSSEVREGVVQQEYDRMKAAPPATAGAAAVDRAVGETGLRRADKAPSDNREQVRAVDEKSFVQRQGVWTDTTYDASKMTLKQIGFGGDTYFKFLAAHPEWGRYFALGQNVIVVLNEQAYQILEGEFPPVEVPGD